MAFKAQYHLLRNGLNSNSPCSSPGRKSLMYQTELNFGDKNCSSKKITSKRQTKKCSEGCRYSYTFDASHEKWLGFRPPALGNRSFFTQPWLVVGFPPAYCWDICRKEASHSGDVQPDVRLCAAAWSHRAGLHATAGQGLNSLFTGSHTHLQLISSW